jgi:serine/threonine protein kinase
MSLSVGSRIGPYEIDQLLGEGGMGEVWKARDTRLDRLVAIKQLKTPDRARFLAEARAVAALNHPNICTLHDIGTDYLVMEYIEGHPVRSPDAPGPLRPPDVRRTAIQMAAALQAAHARNLVHLDLKPANIFVKSDGSVKVLDFGIAQWTRNRECSAPSDSTITVVVSAGATISGTPAYMSPEQAEGKPLDARSDIHSFGAVVYEC